MNDRYPRRSLLSTGATALGLSALSYSRVLGANQRVGIGFVGYGLIGRRHVADFRLEPDVDLVAVCDAHRGRVQEGLAATGNPRARGFADFRALLDEPNIQAVVISTPDHWHALQTMLACHAGKDVYVEKPLTLFQREGRWMIDVAAKTQRVVQVGTQQRSGIHYQSAKEFLRSDGIGKVHAVRMQSLRNIGKGFRSPTDVSLPGELDWAMWQGPAPEREYHPNRAIYHFRWIWDYAGGQMTNLGAHHLDIVDWILGLGKLQRVSSIGGRLVLRDHGETPDTQETIFDCGDFIISYSLRECSGSDRSSTGLEFAGTKGQLSISRAGYKVSSDPDLAAESLIPGIGEHPAGGPAGVPRSQQRKLLIKDIDDRSGSSDEQYRLHVRNFLDCMKSRQTPISDLASAHRTATACHLANISLRLGRQIQWDKIRESVINDAEADAMLTRAYRAPWDAALKAVIG